MVSLCLCKADREELELGLVLKECLESTGKAHSFLLHFSRALSRITQFSCYQTDSGGSSHKMFNGIRESMFSGMHLFSSSSDLSAVFGVLDAVRMRIGSGILPRVISEPD
jgi:hypothetical protein